MHGGLDPGSRGLDFLAGSGDMGAKMRAHGWSTSPLGPPATWSQPLKTLVSVMLASNQPMFVAWGPERTLLYNDAYAEILAAKHPAALGCDFLEVWSEIRADLVPIVAKAYAGEPVHMDDIKLVMLRKGYLEETHFAFSYTPVRDETGEVAGFFCPLNETTGQVLAKMREAEVQDRQRQMLKQMPGFVGMLSGPDLVYTYVNDAYVAISERTDFIGRRFRDVFADIQGQGFHELFENVFHSGKGVVTRGMELRLHGREDKQYVDFVLEPIRDDDGVVTGVFVGGYETTEVYRGNELLERRVAAALAERKLVADLVEGTDAFVQVADRDYRWLAINKAAADEFERIFGVRPKVGDCMLDLLAGMPGHREAVKAVWGRALAGNEFTETAEFGDPGRDRRCYEMKYNVLRDADGTMIGAYQFVYDVTERVEQQRRLHEAEEQLRQAQKMEAVGQLTGGVAHDFNNLLTIIKSSTDLLRRPDLSEERRSRYVAAISDTVDRASKLTGQLLAFARRQALKPEVFDAAERLRGIGDMIRTLTGSRIQIVAEITDEPCLVEADLSQFETALVNMAVNARDAMNGEGRLGLRVEGVTDMPAIRGHGGGSGRFVAISISDTGVGIPAEKLAHIFEPFFTTKEVGKGTGLGLSQVYGFAKQSGGDVAVASEVGRGTVFTLYLPRTSKSASDEETPEAREIGPAEGRGRRVLVVEDNVEVGQFSTQILQDLGYETTWAANAEEALQLLTTVDGFDVVFSDVVMPGMSGVELGREIRRLKPRLPVVLTSGYSHVLAEEGRHGFELLQKPYAAEELSRVLRRVTRRRAVQADTTTP
jgi:signal transduction histidine kinase/ActR/RegA family two-component response regulator